MSQSDFATASRWFAPERGRDSIRQLHFQDQIGQARHSLGRDGLDLFQFVTLYSHASKPVLASDQAKQLLLSKLLETKIRFRLDIAGYVMLDDHLHLLYVAHSSQSIETVVNALRDGFSRDWRSLLYREAESGVSIDQPCWRQDFHSYPLTRVDELRTHLNFIHYDPVRHGCVSRAANYAWSSFPARVHQGHYPENWAEQAPPAGLAKVARALYLTS